MGNQCNKQDKDGKDAIDRKEAVLEQNPSQKQNSYTNGGNLNDEWGHNNQHSQRDRVFESRYVEQPVATENFARAIPDRTINSQYQSDIRGPTYNQNDMRNSYYDRREEPLYDMKGNSTPMNQSYNTGNGKQNANFYEENFNNMPSHINRSSHNNQMGEDVGMSSNHNRIFDDGPRRNLQKSAQKTDSKIKSGIENPAKSSNIYLSGDKGFKPDDADNQRDQPVQEAFNNYNVTNTSNTNNNTFKDFLNMETPADKLADSKALKYRSQLAPRNADKSFDKAENKSNVKVAVKSELPNGKYPNSQNNRDSHREYNGQGFDKYTNNMNKGPFEDNYGQQNSHFNYSRTEPVDDFGYKGSHMNRNDQNSNYDRMPPTLGSNYDPTNREEIKPLQKTGPLSEYMRMSAYGENNTFKGIEVNDFDGLKPVSDVRGIRESNFHNLPDHQPTKSELKSSYKNKLTNQKEQIDSAFKPAPIRLGNGNSYVGNMANNLPHGKGKEVISNGDVYNGDYVEGKRHGEGTFEKKDDFIYIGTFRNNKFEGKGKKLYPNGDKFEGMFRNGKEEGTGVLKDIEGVIIKHGMWIDGEYTAL